MQKWMIPVAYRPGNMETWNARPRRIIGRAVGPALGRRTDSQRQEPPAIMMPCIPVSLTRVILCFPARQTTPCLVATETSIPVTHDAIWPNSHEGIRVVRTGMVPTIATKSGSRLVSDYPPLAMAWYARHRLVPFQLRSLNSHWQSVSVQTPPRQLWHALHSITVESVRRKIRQSGKL
jgi:hypothetical protein